MSTSYRESFAQQPLQSVIASYLYKEYADDDTLQAFVNAYNGLAQTYLSFMTATSIGLYTDSAIRGTFLDFIGANLYGILRPSIGSFSQSVLGYYASALPFGGMPAFAMLDVTTSGTATAVTDDVYKRVLTWFTYLGDGKQMSIPWLKRRIARFLYGANGSDVTASELKYVGIAYSGTAHEYTITIPASSIASVFQALVQANPLWYFPFQMTFTVSIS